MSTYDAGSLLPALATLAEEAARLAATRGEAEAAWQRRRLELADEGRRLVEPLRAAAAAHDPAAAGEAAATAALAEARRRLEAVAAAAARRRRQAREALDRRLEAQRAAEAEAVRSRLVAGAGTRAETLRGLATQRQRAQELEAEVHRQAQRLGGGLPPAAEAGQPDLPPGTDGARALAGLTSQLDQLAGMLPRLARSWPARLGHPAGRVGLHVVGLVPAAGLAWAVPDPAMVPWAGTLLVVSQLVAWGTHRELRPRALAHLAFVRDTLLAAGRRAAAVERLAADPAAAARHAGLDAVLAAGVHGEEANRAAREAAERNVQALRAREAHIRARIEARMQPAAEAARRAAVAQVTAALAADAARVAAAEAAAQRRVAEADAGWAAERASLDAALADAAQRRQAVVAAARATLSAQHPAWPAADWHPATDWPAGLPVGDADDAGLAVPVALPYPAAAGLLVHAGAERRVEAIGLVAGAALRALLSTPPGRLRLTLIDPVGLGQGFAPLLALADLGEAVLPGGLATEVERIERVLADLCAHVEAVIRTRLRGTYETIADYNAEAGDLQEPIRLVAVADFPAGFGERASERLAVLLRTGARCGVHVLLHHDARVRLAPELDAALTRSAALTVREAAGGLVLDSGPLRGRVLTPPPQPTGEVAARLVAAAGAAAVQAARVEVDFGVVAPPDGALWSLSTAERLRVPVGVRGAGQLQYLELGRGTAQHVLIGGRTGSGKSTLLHVIVTSAALWFPPRELEVHLIDFKKGVEFQAYAATRLPHARVVAVESDREFGLSVLRRLDAELARRGELFRAAGAQDLAAHRAAGGVHLPRVLLLIDEFQEFFTEDDVIARDAALLLDRFVRQGRAFGVHVVLGSQTLSGAYSLAKSSLGQMGVRIVLPCNETDAHLLLHEDNDAVRLLTRPGEAIYNDQAGLAEGNSPFQVCWLSDRSRTALLAPLAARAAADGWTPSSPTVVFAGDSPARLDEDDVFAALLAAVPSPRTAAAVGASSSLRGAAEVVLPAASGGNLLIVGQNREAATATLAAMALGLAARHPVGGLRLVALDGEDADGPFASVWTALGGALPHGATRAGPRELTALLDDLCGLVDRRQSGEDPARTPVLLAVNAMQRLRALRPDDDAPFDRTAEPPAERFSRLLAGGPEVGLHVAVWCDALAGVQRSLPRRALRDFDLRICFQMSPSDSTELIDDDGAGRLGLHGALLAVLAEGRREKFRPYQIPDAAFLARIGAALRQRSG